MIPELTTSLHFYSIGRHITAVTNHKSESSLKTYTGYTTEKKRKDMSKILSTAASGKSASCTIVAPAEEQTQSSKNADATSVFSKALTVDSGITDGALLNTDANSTLDEDEVAALFPNQRKSAMAPLEFNQPKPSPFQFMNCNVTINMKQNE